MRIKLDDKHYLNSDKFCCWITLKVKSDKNAKGFYERVIGGYHANIRDCLYDYLKTGTNSSQAVTLSGVLEDITEIGQRIDKFCESINADVREAGE